MANPQYLATVHAKGESDGALPRETFLRHIDSNGGIDDVPHTLAIKVDASERKPKPLLIVKHSDH